MSVTVKSYEKSQTERLIDRLERGHNYNFIRAFHVFGIQDLRKRLCEVRELGYRLKVEEKTFEGHRTSYWSFDQVLRPGHYVRIEAPAVFPQGRHPLRGSFGVVLGKEGHRYIVGDSYGQPIGRFRHKDLHLVAELPKDAMVRLVADQFTVKGFEPQSGDYIVESITNGAGYLFSPELLRRI